MEPSFINISFAFLCKSFPHVSLFLLSIPNKLVFGQKTIQTSNNFFVIIHLGKWPEGEHHWHVIIRWLLVAVLIMTGTIVTGMYKEKQSLHRKETWVDTPQIIIIGIGIEEYETGDRCFFPFKTAVILFYPNHNLFLNLTKYFCFA